MKRSVLAVVSVVVTSTTWLAAQQQNLANVQLDVQAVQGNVHMLSGAGGNMTLHVGKDGALLVDTSFAPMAPKIMTEIQKLTSGPLLYIINTHVHPDHVGGNEALMKMSPQLNIGPNGLTGGQRVLRIIAHENVLTRLGAGSGNETIGSYGLPRDSYFTPFKDVRFNGEAVFVYHEPNAHTDGDSIVLFRASDVVSAGDIFTPDAYPFIDLDRGGSAQGEIDALNHILELTVPARTQEGGTMVIPGHGRLSDEADVVEFRDMVVIVRDRVRDMVKKGMSLDQVKAAKPSRDYDPAYVTQGSFVPADRFVESIYRSLTKSK